MGKKKEVSIKLNETRDIIPVGDVNIMYGHDLIASLSDDGVVRLETENTIVTKYIAVEYEKPAGPIIGVPVTITKLTSETVTAETTENYAVINSDNLIIKAVGTYEVVNATAFNNTLLIPVQGGDVASDKMVALTIISETDAFDVTLNGNPVAFAGRENYICTISKATFTADDVMNITIADKANTGK